MTMTRTTRKLIVAKLTALGGSRRIWSRWLQRAFTDALRVRANLTWPIPNQAIVQAKSDTIRMARELLNS